MGRQRRRPWPTRSVRLALVAGLFAAVAVPALALAHPLGNFTINHYAGIRIDRGAIRLDVVIDRAEIPAFEAKATIDLDGDAVISPAETDAGRRSGCRDLARALDLQVAGSTAVLVLEDAGLAFPPGAGGLTTMRLVCGYHAALATPIAAATSLTFADHSFAERIGWREIVVAGSGVTPIAGADGAPLRATSVSDRLTSYPADRIGRPLADASLAVTVTPGGPILPETAIPDASPIDEPAAVAAAPTATGNDETTATNASVPGGVTAGELPSIFRTADLTPFVLLVSLGTALVLGAGHALTPGHGKTLMAAYLVGTRGTPLHAAGLGLSVALSHTIGILALAAVVVGAQGVLAPDVVVRTAPVVAAISIVLIGGWMLAGELRRRRREATADHDHAAAHDHGHAHPPERDHGHDHPHGHGGEHPLPGPGEHSHGGVRHSHLPKTGTTITWRSLFMLGLAGGLIPSTSALLMLLGSIAAGRPAFGFVLVVAFGLGMALVMGSIGFALVFARGRLDRVDARSNLGRVGAFVPLVASCLVLALGLYLTVQAVAGTPVL